MASPILKVLLATLLILALVLPDYVSDATDQHRGKNKKHQQPWKKNHKRNWKWRKGGNRHGHGGRHRNGGRHRHRRTQPKTYNESPRTPTGGWKKAHATFYEGNANTFGGACGYEDVNKEGFGIGTAALSTVLFNNGASCGACFEIKCCDSPQWCKPGKPSLFVTGTNLCPPNFQQDSNNGGWCNPPREHFDIAYPAFSQIAEYKAGIVPVKYRRVPCKKQGGIRFLITGNSYYHMVSVWNVGGAGDISSLEVKGDNKLPWTKLKRNWGQKWQTDAKLCGEALTFKVGLSDGKVVILPHVFPKTWTFSQTFEGKNVG
ncbi:hypothetical protein Pint_35752 [Pistacia integerrima]|uniref:Uncharacterized protein n=1 Tax=Pistacia integerrima TaxID=434235 RepID=A0ACC0Y4U8_9ROSI|nr:hypothetical protein Pint_35752 [Pistacia integerrima]